MSATDSARRSNGFWNLHGPDGSDARYAWARAAAGIVEPTDITTRNFPGMSGADLAQTCALDPNCTTADFAAMSPDDRIAWLDQFQSVYQTNGWFNNVRGVLRAFRDKGKISGSKWYSLVDAATLEAINNGHALSMGVTPRQLIDGSTEWANFFRTQASFGSLQDLRATWGKAEYTAIHAADDNVIRQGTSRSKGEMVFMQYGDLYRMALQTGNTSDMRDATSSLVLPEVNNSDATTGFVRIFGLTNFAGYGVPSMLTDDQLLSTTNEDGTYNGTTNALDSIDHRFP